MLSEKEKEFLEVSRLDITSDKQIMVLFISRWFHISPVEGLAHLRGVITDVQEHAIGRG